jgi:hypothetical protein
MIETGVVINTNGEPIHWHEPAGRSGGNLPDSRSLWNVLWQAQQHGWLAGFAHTHPGSGVPGPSSTDISTFVAIENALGRSLAWWIASADRMVITRRSVMDSVPGREIYASHEIVVQNEPIWVAELRRRSAMGVHPYR